MNERIKLLRKNNNLTQQEFAKMIGTSQNVLANWESGRRNPSASVINNICKTFNVNEEWLRTGKGDMFAKKSSVDIAYNHFGSLMNSASIQKKAMVSALVEMMYYFPDDKWNYVFEQFKNCLEEAQSIPDKLPQNDEALLAESAIGEPPSKKAI